MVAFSLFWVVFRLFHIVCGVLWVGASFLFVGFIGPSAVEAGPSAGPLLAIAVRKRKVTKIITALAIITVVAGWVMWIRHAVDAGFGNWLSSGFGIGLTIGGVLATIAAGEGYSGVGKNVERMVDLGEQAAEGPPPPELVGAMETLQGKLKRHGQRDLILQLLAVVAMATARYW
jgi:uncharacterized membrane protein